MDPNDIAEALATALIGVDEVDSASTSDFLPALESQGICALLVPFEQEGTFEQQDLSGYGIWVKRAVKFEFWCKHDQAQPGESLRRARSIGQKAVIRLMQQDGNGYTIDRNMEFRERVDTGFVTVGNVPWLVVHLYVPLEIEVTL